VILEHRFRLSEVRDVSFDRWARPASVILSQPDRLIEVMRVPCSLASLRMVLRSLSDNLNCPERSRQPSLTKDNLREALHTLRTVAISGIERKPAIRPKTPLASPKTSLDLEIASTASFVIEVSEGTTPTDSDGTATADDASAGDVEDKCKGAKSRDDTEVIIFLLLFIMYVYFIVLFVFSQFVF